MKRKNQTDILSSDELKQCWKKLQTEISGQELRSVAYHLVAIANREKPFGWKPPTPRQARSFADHLLTQAEKMEGMNLYYGAELPLGDPAIKNLPEHLFRYAQKLKVAPQNRDRMRPPNHFIEREIEILRLLDRSEPGRENHHYEQAAELISAAYAVAKLKRNVDADQLRKLYDRQSLRYRLGNRPRKSPKK